ncbi:ribosome-binding factor A, partial [Butyricicoccus sp. 1XD8-22]
TEIGHRIRLRRTPEITFEYDASVEYGNKIEQLLRNLNQQ